MPCYQQVKACKSYGVFPNFIDPEYVLINIHLGQKWKGQKKKTPSSALAADYLCWLKQKQKTLWAAGWLCVFETGILKNKLIYKMLIVKIEENEFFFHCKLICSTVLHLNPLVRSLFFQVGTEREFRNEGEVCKTAIKTQFFN